MATTGHTQIVMIKIVVLEVPPERRAEGTLRATGVLVGIVIEVILAIRRKVASS